jgi:predicted alpha/beta hydrolase
MKNSCLSFLQWSLVFIGTILSAQAEKITFPAADGLEVTADLYRASEDLATPMIVLFHQAGFSRGEYLQIAPRLGGMGFNCLAVDQRSGKATAGVTDETAASGILP